MANKVTDSLKKAFLVGVGATALTVEKSTEVFDTLVKKGEETVEKGKALNQELKHKIEDEKTEEKESLEDIVKNLSEDEVDRLKKLLNQDEEKES